MAGKDGLRHVPPLESSLAVPLALLAVRFPRGVLGRSTFSFSTALSSLALSSSSESLASDTSDSNFARFERALLRVDWDGAARLRGWALEEEDVGPIGVAAERVETMANMGEERGAGVADIGACTIFYYRPYWCLGWTLFCSVAYIYKLIHWLIFESILIIDNMPRSSYRVSSCQEGGTSVTRP